MWTLLYQHPTPFISLVTTKNHMIINPEKNTVTVTRTASFPSFFPSYKETPGLRNHHTYVDCQPIPSKKVTGKTVRFFVPSVSGKNYHFILFNVDSSFIFAEPMPIHTKKSIKNYYDNILKKIKNRGLKLQLHILDNEDSDIAKYFII